MIEVFKNFIAKGVIKQGTLIEAYYSSLSLSCIKNNKSIGEFVIIGAKVGKDGIIFETKNETGNGVRIPISDIVKIDGMDVARVIEIYDIKEDTTKRRGRKPRVKEDDGTDIT